MPSNTLGFAAFAPNQRITRRPKNPLDKCTIVSVYPVAIVDYKPTAFPQTHRIEGAADGDYSVTVVEAAGWYKEMEENQPFMEIPITSIQVAEAFIRDFVNALPEYVPEVAAPGMFFVLGAYTKETIKKYIEADELSEDGKIIRKGRTFDQLITAARARQNQWFMNIVRMADTDWARSNGNPRAIGETQKMAAEKLQLKEKPWLKDFQAVEKKNCPACGQLINPDFPICFNCKNVIDPVKAKALNLTFAS